MFFQFRAAVNGGLGGMRDFNHTRRKISTPLKKLSALHEFHQYNPHKINNNNTCDHNARNRYYNN